MPTPDRCTFRLGDLAEPLHAAAAKSGRTLSEEIRSRLARSLKVPAPEMPAGNPNMAQIARQGNQARWGKRQA